MTSRSRSASLTVLMIALLLPGYVLAKSDKHFSNRSLDGGYAGSANGTEWLQPANLSDPPGKVDVATATLFNFDGAGNLSGSITVVSQGTISPSPPGVCVYSSLGTYTVNPDGTGTATFSNTKVSGTCPDSTAAASFVLSGQGTIVNLVFTSASITPSGQGSIVSLILATTLTKQ